MIQVKPIPAFHDNYIWAIMHVPSQHCLLVDPGDAEPAEEFIKKNQLKLDGILITHHHADHCGGLPQLLQNHAVPVYAPFGLLGAPHLASIHPKFQAAHSNEMKDIMHYLKQNDVISFFNNTLSLRVIETPGHTLDHIVYYGGGMLFCGDTLFSAGCGRIFEGTAAQMWESLQKLADHPPETLIYCAHEYTADNLRFAQSLEPQNKVIKSELSDVLKIQCTLPTTIEKEKRINPYFRTHSPELKASLKKDDPFQLFKKIRDSKDQW